eukprot:362839-Chlamydomonas_euryale.AAC.2
MPSRRTRERPACLQATNKHAHGGHTLSHVSHFGDTAGELGRGGVFPRARGGGSPFTSLQGAGSFHELGINNNPSNRRHGCGVCTAWARAPGQGNARWRNVWAPQAVALLLHHP